jgi:hypothetical protein
VRHEGRIGAGGIGKDVLFRAAGAAAHDEIDDAYRSKYRRHAAQYVESVTNAAAHATTIELLPR